MADMSQTDLEKERTRIVVEIQDLNERIGGAPKGQARKTLERQRDLKNNGLKMLDAEFRRRGLDPLNG